MTPKRRKSRRARRRRQQLVKRFDELCKQLPILQDALQLEQSILFSLTKL